MIDRAAYSILLLLSFSLAICSARPVHSSPLAAFFFDSKSLSVDEDNDGGDDYILVQFDVDLDEDVTSSVTVIVTLYDQMDNAVATRQLSFRVTGQEEGYAGLSIIPTPNIEGTYYAHIALSDLSDEMYIDDIYYNPQLGSEPLAYFADFVASSEMDGIEVELDVNLVQQMTWNVNVYAELLDSAGDLMASRRLDYQTFFEDVDYRTMNFTPPGEDAYSVVILAYPEGSGAATDSRLLQVLWPPGTGAYFRHYDAKTSDERIEVTFDVDLAYNITYAVSVEVILYDPESHVAGYNYIPYLTNGSSEDERSISVSPEQALAGTYYMELIVYTDGRAASYGYIEEIPWGRPRWDINQDSIVDHLDLIVLGGSFGKRASELENPNADINDDGVVDIKDLITMAAHYGKSWGTSDL